MDREKNITTEHPMKWYRFTVSFHLFAFAVIYVIQAITHLQGLMQGFGSAEELYVEYPALKQVEVVLAVLGFGIAVLSLVARRLLRLFHPRGPKIYLVVMALAGCYHFIYSALASLVIGLPVFTAYDMGGVLSTVAIVVLCRGYYENRKELFQK